MAPRRPTAPRPGTPRATGKTPDPPGAPARPAPGVPARPAPGARSTAGARPPSAPRSGGLARPPASGRPPARPAAGSPTLSAFGVPVASRPRPALVRPVTIVSGVLVVLALLLAPYVRPWVTQRAQLAEGRRQLDALHHQVDELSAERQRWNDPAYVRAQARERLGYVMPGETGYVLLGDPARRAATPGVGPVPVTVPDAASGSTWYGRVWDSVRTAGEADASATPDAGGTP